ncbi:hypothetical protein DCO56_10615 [Sphingobacterium athyrii]|uniref:DUF5018 domain-containing protein n=2 Tax=Sphingobacterium athyrii TaxID=2152717 RepID=A0A363NSP1_9SPHI|nr:hypothetical protein DCO56_10615 [Sphingobacterium athyrii]
MLVPVLFSTKMKNQLLTTHKFVIASSVFISSLLASSCTKTETQPFEQESKARISSFKIVNTSKEIIGAIDNETKTITVTLPEGLYMTSLEPEIEVASGATLKQGTDTLITNMVDYFAKGRTIEYPVTATDGSTATYTLIVKSDQPALHVQEISSDPNAPVIYDQSNWYTTNTLYIYNNLISYPYIATYESDLELARASLVDKDGKEYPFKQASTANPPSVASAYMNLSLNNIEGRLTGPANAPVYNKVPAAGDYYVKVRYYSREETLKNPIRIIYNN